MHSNFSSDADASLDEIFSWATSIGLTEIGITDHASFFSTDADYVLNKNYYSYQEELEKGKAKFSDYLHILLGVEIDYYYEAEKKIQAFLQQYPFDYYIVSVHKVAGWSLTEEYFYKRFTPEEGIRKYIYVLKQAIRGLPGGILAHVDWIKRGWQKYWPEFPYEADYLLQCGLADVLREAVQNGIFLEINSSGYRRGMGEPFPGAEILACYKEMGGKYCVLGSDAHHKKEIAVDFDRVKEVAEYLGLQLVTVSSVKYLT